MHVPRVHKNYPICTHIHKQPAEQALRAAENRRKKKLNIAKAAQARAAKAAKNAKAKAKK
jgi:hypothetical protein